MSKAVIVGACRTPIGNMGGSLTPLTASELGKVAIEEALKRSGISKDEVEEVIMGNVLQGGQGMNPARQAAVKAGIPYEVPSFAVNKVCGSGLKAIALAAQSVICDEAEIVVCGGMESMSNVPYYLLKARFGYRMGDDKIIDGMVYDGLWCPFGDYHMGITAENVATKLNISREEQDLFSYHSHRKAVEAQEKGIFDEEIVAVYVPQKKGEPTPITKDEHPRADTSVEKLNKLRPAFKEDGTVTAGNASGINDAAAAMLVMSEKRAIKEGIEPLAEIVSFASAGVDPAYMGLGPVNAVRKALKKAGLQKEDIDLWELNEAFAAQSLGVIKELELNSFLDKVNVNGGAIALGHPIGASGARILVTLLYEMKRRNALYGLSTLCIGGGQGIAMVVKRYKG